MPLATFAPSFTILRFAGAVWTVTADVSVAEVRHIERDLITCPRTGARV